MTAVATATHLTRMLHAVYDDPRRWGTPGIWQPPDSVDLIKWQQRIDDIIGRTPSNKPIIRIIWAWKARSLHHTDWDGLGKPIKAAWRQRYRFMTVKLPSGEEVDISVPRFILEELFPVSLLRKGWEEARYSFDPILQKRVDRLGDLPQEGYYRYLYTINEHEEDEACCDRALYEQRRRCWGYYREPQEKDLRALERAKYLRDAEGQKREADEPLSAEEVTQLYSDAYAEERYAKEKAYNDLRGDMRAWAITHAWKVFTQSHKRLHHGHWQPAWPVKEFEKYTTTSSGILVPKEGIKTV